MTNMARPSERVLSFVEQRPDRFNLGLGGHNLLRPMENLRDLESFVADHPVAYTVIGPSFWGDGMYPPSDAVYYPLYTKCCELDLPLCMNTGLPGPPIPGEVQNPIHLDRVCVRFPSSGWHDARRRPVVGRRHPPDDQVPEPPAGDVGVGAPPPARVAPALHAHARQGSGDVRLGLAGAVDHAGRVNEASELDLPPEVLDNYLYRNAQDFLFSRDAGTDHRSI